RHARLLCDGTLPGGLVIDDAAALAHDAAAFSVTLVHLPAELMDEESFADCNENHRLNGELDDMAFFGAVLDDAGVDSWMHSLNALRLVLGERLDVDVIGHDVLHDLEPDDDRVPIVALYEWLGWLLEQLVGAAMNSLDD
ncbi:MAG: DUF2017 family protein, partial [Acidimicrobiales bacterium]|nr:DUF2017 family protein [Acidimicrobiales bacterium]